MFILWTEKSEGNNNSSLEHNEREDIDSETNLSYMSDTDYYDFGSEPETNYDSETDSYEEDLGKGIGIKVVLDVSRVQYVLWRHY